MDIRAFDLDCENCWVFDFDPVSPSGHQTYLNLGVVKVHLDNRKENVISSSAHPDSNDTKRSI